MAGKRWDLMTTKPQRWNEWIFRWNLTKMAAILTCRQINKELRDSGDNWTRYYPVVHKLHTLMDFPEFNRTEESMKYL